MRSNPTKAAALEITEVDDGLVIYQGSPERVHYLNRTAAVVFELCTGESSDDEITTVIADAFALDAPPASEVARCLEHLRREGLVV